MRAAHPSEAETADHADRCRQEESLSVWSTRKSSLELLDRLCNRQDAKSAKNLAKNIKKKGPSGNP